MHLQPAIGNKGAEFEMAIPVEHPAIRAFQANGIIILALALRHRREIADGKCHGQSQLMRLLAGGLGIAQVTIGERHGGNSQARQPALFLIAPHRLRLCRVLGKLRLGVSDHIIEIENGFGIPLGP